MLKGEWQLCRGQQKFRDKFARGEFPEKRQGLGDHVANTLKCFHLTPEQYREAKRKFGLPPTCNCTQRQEWLNKVGRLFGIGV